jgi:hypothetical protein
MTLELPTQSAKKLPKPEELIPLLTSPASSTSTRCNLNAGHAFASSPPSNTSRLKVADLHILNHLISSTFIKITYSPRTITHQPRHTCPNANIHFKRIETKKILSDQI